MMDILFWIAVGAFVGWNVPQPGYAIWIEAKVRGWIGKFSKGE